jgi:hypothetical protein
VIAEGGTAVGGKTVEMVSRHLGTNATRRKLAGGIIGATAAVLAGRTLVGAVKGGKAKGKSKTPICHYDDETGLYTFVQVPVKAEKGHTKHSEDVFVDLDDAPVTREYCASLNPEPEPEPVI